MPVSTKPVPVKREQEPVKVNRQHEHPVAPPLPEFLKKLSSLHSHKQHMTALVEPPKKEPFKLSRVGQMVVTKEELIASRSDLKSCQLAGNNASSHGDILMMHQHYYQHHLGRKFEIKARLFLQIEPYLNEHVFDCCIILSKLFHTSILL